MKMTIVIYKTAVSPPARAVLMVVDFLGISVETREVNLPRRDQFQPEYLEKNPMHSVPLLEDGDLVLSDSHAIITYLVSKYGGEHTNLYPKDIAGRAKVDQRLYFDASILFPRLRSVIYSVVKYKASITDEQMNDIIDAYDITERYLQKTLYIAGDYLTLADISCVATLSSLNCIIPIGSKYNKLLSWWKLLKSESWYKKENEPGVMLFENFIKQFL